MNDRAAVERAAAMLEAMGGRDRWANLRSLHIRAIHYEDRRDAPYESEIIRNIGIPEVLIRQETDTLVSERYILNDSACGVTGRGGPWARPARGQPHLSSHPAESL